MLYTELSSEKRERIFGGPLIAGQAVFDEIEKFRNKRNSADIHTIGILVKESMFRLYGPKAFSPITIEQSENHKTRPSRRFNFGDIVRPISEAKKLRPRPGDFIKAVNQIQKEVNVPNAAKIIQPLFEGPHQLDLSPKNLEWVREVLEKRYKALKRNENLTAEDLQEAYPLIEIIHPPHGEAPYARIKSTP